MYYDNAHIVFNSVFNIICTSRVYRHDLYTDVYNLFLQYYMIFEVQHFNCFDTSTLSEMIRRYFQISEKIMRERFLQYFMHSGVFNRFIHLSTLILLRT